MDCIIEIENIYHILLLTTHMLLLITPQMIPSLLALICSRVSSLSILNCKHVILVVSKLDIIFPLHSERKNIISSTPMCYAKCHDVNNISLNIILMLTYSIIPVIGGHDTLGPPSI